MTRILLFTGKGGVGKTSVAAATAQRIAAQGRRVLVTSTDAAHSLSDAFDTPLGDRPTPVLERLDAQQIDAQQRLEHQWHEVRDYLVELLSWGGVGDIQAEELVLLPGLDELFALVDLLEQATSGRYDTVVVDCAPTAETLRLLAMPDALRWYVERVLNPGRKVANVVRPVVSRLGSSTLAGGRMRTMPLPPDGVFSAVERIHGNLATVHHLLQDPTRSTVRLVVNPERMVVAEAVRTATSLSLFGYAVDAVVVNRVLPDDVTDPWFAKWRERQAEHLETIRSCFAPLPILTAPLFDDELVGPPGLARLGDALHADDGTGRAIDPDAVLHVSQPLTIDQVEGGYVLRLALPFATKDDLDLARRQQDLHVKVGGVKRTLPLPAVLQRCEIAGARLRDQQLEVRFAAPQPVASGPPA